MIFSKKLFDILFSVQKKEIKKWKEQEFLMEKYVLIVGEQNLQKKETNKKKETTLRCKTCKENGRYVTFTRQDGTEEWITVS